MILSSTDEGHVLLGLPSIERQTGTGNPSTTIKGSSKVMVMSVVRDKWKNHFSEMKGDVGMSLHEKEGEQEDAYIETGSH